MLTKSDKAVLGESLRSTRLCRETVNVLIGKALDEDLALDLNRQACKFAQLEEKTLEEYYKENEPVPQSHLAEKTKLWGSIQASTLLNASTSRLAELMIQSNSRGIVDLMKTVKSNKGMQTCYYELAQEIMDFEEKNIEKLKAYLR